MSLGAMIAETLRKDESLIWCLIWACGITPHHLIIWKRIFQLLLRNLVRGVVVLGLLGFNYED
jgi:hypothetical protein